MGQVRKLSHGAKQQLGQVRGAAMLNLLYVVLRKAKTSESAFPVGRFRIVSKICSESYQL